MKFFQSCLSTGMAILSGAILSVGAAQAQCVIDAGSVRIVTNDFPALRHVIDVAAECVGDEVTLTRNHSVEHESLHIPALSANPAEYTAAFVSIASIQPLLGADLIRPLDDYIAQYGNNVSERQKIMVDGRTMAVAFNLNSQHLYYRRDILQQAGLDIPKTYEEMLASAETIRAQGLMQYPLGGTYKAGWNLATEFINMYLGHGGEFFVPGTAQPAINNEEGIAALNMMKDLTEYMNPDVLTFDSNSLQAEFEAGQVALANFWGSRYGAVMAGAEAEIAEVTRVAAAPTVAGGDIPAAALWWDGYVIARNISEADAMATFRALNHGASAAMANLYPDDAVWLMEGYDPAPAMIGVLSSMEAGARPYPMLPFMGLMHAALGSELVAFMQGRDDAATALAKVEAAYMVAAKEQGFLK